MSEIVIPGVGPEAMAREGLAADPAPWEDGLRADTGRGSFEWWYFDAHLDDGSTAVITFSTKPLLQRNDPLSPLVLLTITGPDGRKLSEASIVAPDQFSAAADHCDVRMGVSRVEHENPGGASWRYDLSAETESLAAHLTFTGSVPPWRPGAGKTYYATDFSRYFAWFPAIPFGTVTGDLIYDGQTHAVTGTGYHDHNWGSVGLDAVMSHWFWGRAHVGDYTLIYVEMVSNAAHGGVKLPVFMLAKGDRILIGDGRPLTLETSEDVQHAGGRRYPQRLDWFWQFDGGTVRLALREPQVIEATSLLGLLPLWKRVLARLVANPYYFRFNADLELEVDLGAHELVRGPSLYELMLLR